MRWASIDLPNRLIRFVPQKTRRKKNREIILPMHEELEGYLLSVEAPDHEDAFLFPSLQGRGSGGSRGLSRDFQRVMLAAGRNAGLREAP